MGSTFEVWEYTIQITRDGRQSWGFIERYHGESFLSALWMAWKLKRRGSGCVRLEWR